MLEERIKDRARSIGFQSVGITRPALAERDRARLRELIAEGGHGTMDWMARRIDERGDPLQLWPEVRSVIALGLSYAPGMDPMRRLQHRDRAVISVYALNRDYHDLVKKRLKQLARWLIEEAGGEVKVFVDTAPVLEKPLAARSGIGWQGKHSNLVSREHGSWLFLGEVFTSLDLEADPGETDHCGSCRRCLEICPTDAFPAPYRLDPRRCISYLTIEHKGPIPEEFRKPIGNRIYGCDDCLAVCPWNKFAETAREAAFLPRAELTAPRLADFLDLDDAGFRQLFAGSPVKRIGRTRFLRNVLTALGNCGDPALMSRAEPLTADPDPTISEAAHWCLSQRKAALQ